MQDQDAKEPAGNPPAGEVPGRDDDILVVEAKDAGPSGVELLEELHPAGDEEATAPRPAGPSPEESLRQQLAQAEATAKDAQERHLRALADYENLRRRTERERGEAQKVALANVLREVLPVVDNLEAALSAPSTAPDGDPFRSGVELISRQLTEVLGRFGLSVVPGEGSPFNPSVHEAVARDEGSPHPHNSVAKVLRKGYLLGDRLLRPAMVRVAVQAEPAVEIPVPESPGPEAADAAEGDESN